MWEHERLKVYGKALDAVDALRAVGNSLPEGHGDLRDQLRRAGNSIVLNIAEGASEYSLADKARFYRFARRSCAECSAVLDLILRCAPAHPQLPAAKAQLDEVGAMLTALVKRTPSRPRAP